VTLQQRPSRTQLHGILPPITCSMMPPMSGTQHSRGKQRDLRKTADFSKQHISCKVPPHSLSLVQLHPLDTFLAFSLQFLNNPKKNIHEPSTLPNQPSRTIRFECTASTNPSTPCSTTNLTTCFQVRPRFLPETLLRHLEYQRLFDKHQRA